MSGQAFTFQINLDPTDLAAAARIRDWPVSSKMRLQSR